MPQLTQKTEDLKSLAEFQQSSGIPQDDQIVLLGKPDLFGGYQTCFYPWQSKFSARQYLTESWNRKLFYDLRSRVMAKGIKSGNLFAGYFDRSFDHLDRLKPVFNFIRKQPAIKFSVVIGKGDYVIGEKLIENMPENLISLTGNNVSVADSRVHFLPMGRDFRSRDLFQQMRPNSKKTILCYCNFSTNTHPIRKHLLETIKDKPFLKLEHMGEFLNYSLSREEFFSRLGDSKFCICPRGNAFDTFRMWDSMYLGTIPIVVREAEFHRELEDLPILFLDSYDAFSELTVDFLEQTYAEFLTRKFNYAKLKWRHWIDRPTGS